MNKEGFFKKNIHYVTVFALGLLLLLIMLNNSYWNKNRIIIWDVYGYTQYLSAGVIYKDIKDPVELYAIDSIYNPTAGSHYYGRHCCTDGCTAIAFKYTMGNAVMMSLFYLSAHFITYHFTSYPADGYSMPYQLAVSLSGLFWAICGMLLLVITLRRWFSPVVSAITLLLVCAGTNYLYYATLEPGMSHIPSFFCITAVMYCMFIWLEKRTWLPAVFFGVAAGMVALIRLPDLVFGIIPGILFVKSFLSASRQQRITLLLQAVAIVVLIVLVFSPQMFYWKYVANTWFHYSYLDERFYFNNPHILEGLFSYRKGWLLYTPVMLFAIAGIVPLIKEKRWLGVGVLLFLAVNIYVVFSWQTWWYGGSYGARCMIQSYAIMAIPLAFMVKLLSEGVSAAGIGRKAFGYAFSVILFLFFALNLFQTFQYRRGIIHYDSMNKKTYWKVFGRKHLTDKEYNDIYNSDI